MAMVIWLDRYRAVYISVRVGTRNTCQGMARKEKSVVSELTGERKQKGTMSRFITIVEHRKAETLG